MHEGNAFETHIDLRAGKNERLATYAIRRVDAGKYEIAEIDSRRSELAPLLDAHVNPVFLERAKSSGRNASFEDYLDAITANYSEMAPQEAVSYYKTLMDLTEDRILHHLPAPPVLSRGPSLQRRPFV